MLKFSSYIDATPYFCIFLLKGVWALDLHSTKFNFYLTFNGKKSKTLPEALTSFEQTGAVFDMKPTLASFEEAVQ